MSIMKVSSINIVGRVEQREPLCVNLAVLQPR